MRLLHFTFIFVIIFLISIITACSKSSTNQNTMPEAQVKKPLQEVLDAKKSEFETRASAEKKKIYADGIEAVTESGVLGQAKNILDTAPDFQLPNAIGKNVQLQTYLNKGPVILTWYRGGWCPYCNLTLHRLQEELPNFKKHGANLLALTPELQDKSMTPAEKNNLEFEVLSDIDNTVARRYGIVFKLTPEVGDAYQKGFDLASYNGNTKNELPLAATYVIDQSGIIRYAYLNADYRNRAEPSDILEALERITDN